MLWQQVPRRIGREGSVRVKIELPPLASYDRIHVWSHAVSLNVYGLGGYANHSSDRFLATSLAFCLKALV